LLLRRILPDLRCAERKAGNNGQLFRLAHLQLPNGSDRKGEDEQVRQDIGHDDTLEDKQLVHAMSYALQGPLLLNRIAQEDEDKSEHETPDDDDCDASDNPIFDVDREDSHVEEQLTEFKRNQSPEIDQCECECHLTGD
jgi:hypothetical protein